mmetsp:Transcript_22477/g.32811  ORF Transcript_22477/g.32811 Transcript_22477/m.32811 type:complete len:386 (-) Transcript_22477:121-1278(-)
MFTSAPCVFSVNYQARCISAQKAYNEKHRFIVGTCSAKDKNELSVLQYDEENNQIEAKAVYSHPHQVWAMEPSPKDSSLVLTASQGGNGTNSVSLYRLQEFMDADDEEEERGGRHNSYDGDLLDLESVSKFSYDPSVFVNTLKWHSMKDSVLALDPAAVTLWSLAEGGVSSVGSISTTTQENVDIGEFAAGGAAWDPHNVNLAAIASDSSLRFIDTRKLQVTSCVSNAHKGGIRDVDYNPNKPLTLITTGDDRKIKMWDARSLSCPVTTMEGHSHWVWCAKYNPFHDQLIISGGSDNLVNLWRIASCSSAPWLGVGLQESEAGSSQQDVDDDPPDVRIKVMDQHEECVYDLAWSAAEAWMYCSLSYEGRVILNHVPSTEKYKILL